MRCSWSMLVWQNWHILGWLLSLSHYKVHNKRKQAKINNSKKTIYAKLFIFFQHILTTFYETSLHKVVDMDIPYCLIWKEDFVSLEGLFLCGQCPFRGTLEWVGHEIDTFLGPEMATSKAGAIWDPDTHQSEPDPHQTDADPQHCLEQGFQRNTWRKKWRWLCDPWLGESTTFWHVDSRSPCLNTFLKLPYSMSRWVGKLLFKICF